MAQHARIASTRGNRLSSSHALALALVMLMVAVLLALPSCKYSDVLTEHVEDPDIGVLDENVEPIYKNNPDAEDRPDLDNITPTDSDDVDDQIEMLPHYDPAASDNGPTKQRIKRQDTPHDEKASEGQASDSEHAPDRSGEGKDEQSEEEGGGEDPSPTSEEESPEGDQEGDGEQLQSDEPSDEMDESDEGGNSGTTVIADPDDGTTEEIAKGTVAAVGEYATITQMLGGAGGLVACDQQWLDDRAADGAFAGSIDKVQAAFTGNAEDGYTPDINLLVNTVKPSVILNPKDVNLILSEDDETALEAAGITVEEVDALGKSNTEDYEIVEVVHKIAQILSAVEGLEYDPLAKFQEYIDFHNEVLTFCYNTNGGYSFKYIPESGGNLYQTRVSTGLEGLNSPKQGRVYIAYIDSLIKSSGTSGKVSQEVIFDSGDKLELINNNKMVTIPREGVGASVEGQKGYMVLDYYLQLSGIANSSYEKAKPSGKYIVMPGHFSDLKFGLFDRRENNANASALFLNAGQYQTKGNWTWLGQRDFPAVLVNDDEIAQTILDSANQPNGSGLYHMEDPYDIIVVPTGVGGDWAEGHVDSFLLAAWALRISYGDEVEENAINYAKDFYKTFFKCEDWDAAIKDWDTSYTTDGGA